MKRIAKGHMMRAALLLLAISGRGIAADLPPSTQAVNPSLTAAEIVRLLGESNARRAAALSGYEGRRSYDLEYRGFPASHQARIEVLAHYTAPEQKSFEVTSASGSTMMQSRVLMKLLEGEREAARAENQRQSALSEENYRFSLLGARPSANGGCYRLAVEPRRENKFLYRGEICVNAADFAVETIDAEPAKNPSFWIRRTRIEHRYRKVGSFWLPASNHSVSSTRLGGTATLSIEYASYELR